MKPNPRLKRRIGGGTLIDLIVIVAVVVGAAMILLPMLAHTKGGRSPRIACINNMKQVSTGLRLFANDNDSRNPDASTNIMSNAELWKLFQLAANDISSPRILVCPEDQERTPAADFLTGSGSSADSFTHPTKRNLALSYFYAAGAEEGSPSRILVGDRNLTRDPKRSDKSPGTDLLTGTQRLGSTAYEVKDLRWADNIHERGGNMAFMDGSAQQLTSGKLREAVMNTGDTNNLIWLPLSVYSRMASSRHLHGRLQAAGWMASSGESREDPGSVCSKQCRRLASLLRKNADDEVHYQRIFAGKNSAMRSS